LQEIKQARCRAQKPRHASLNNKKARWKTTTPSTGLSLKKAVNTLRFLACIRLPMENHTYFGYTQAK
jgi:hypothetical protein